MKRATMKNQHAKNKNARVAFTITGGYSVATANFDGKSNRTKFNRYERLLNTGRAIITRITPKFKQWHTPQIRLSVAFNYFFGAIAHD